MPRTYVKKKPLKYDADSIKEAVEDVSNGSSVYAAAKKYNIPYETLRRWCENPPKVQGSGKTTVLSKEEEKYIVEALVFAAKCGYPLDRKDLQCMVRSYIQSVGRKTPFTNDMPGYDFITGFEKRWKEELSRRNQLPSSPSTSAEAGEIVPSPMKKLRDAILDTISPKQSTEVKNALMNSKGKRRRVQGSCGEVFTTDEVEERLKEEEAKREKKKKPNRRVTAKKVFVQAESEDEDIQPNNSSQVMNNLTIGSWVSINYQSECGKIVKEYRGQITAQDIRNKERYSVKFLAKCAGDGERYIFPDKDDTGRVDVGQISDIFTVPIYNGRFFKFV